MKSIFKLETDRLYLRELSILDSDFMLQLMNTPSWLSFIGDRNVRYKTAASNYISEKIISSYRNNGFGLYLIVLKTKKLPIGICGLVKRDGLLIPDLGFAILPEHEKNGFATEAAKSILLWAKEKLLLPEVCAITTEINNKSIQVLENIGMTFQEKIVLPANKDNFLLYKKQLI
ncbi:MAG: N-acetyltransferase [Sphingobacteriia bacterium]|nr:MAG: N-acetyltransferase [Sphingobacteriia bacterium]